MLAIVTVLVIVALSMLITRLATIALTITGMSRQSARFQARSALTGSGFTTTESESITSHPVRRQIIMMLMLVGSAQIVSVLGGVVIGFARAEGGDDILAQVTLLGVGIGGLLLLASNRHVDRFLQRVFTRLLRRYTDLDVRDYASLLRIHGNYSVSELEVRAGDWLAAHRLDELALSDEGVLVLGIQRRDGSYDGAPRGTTQVQAGDTLIIYGPGERLEDLDRRPSGSKGERARAEALEDQREREAEPTHDPSGG